MAQKIISKIRRTGSATSAVRRLIVTQNGEDFELSTPILKVQTESVIRGGSDRRPVEQYAFRVGKQTVERFADAAALVLRKHHVSMPAELQMGSQAYVRRAFRILSGAEEMKLAPEEFHGMEVYQAVG